MTKTCVCVCVCILTHCQHATLKVSRHLPDNALLNIPPAHLLVLMEHYTETHIISDIAKKVLNLLMMACIFYYVWNAEPYIMYTTSNRIPALRWGLLLAHRMALNLDSSVPSLFSPAAYRAYKQKNKVYNQHFFAIKLQIHKHTLMGQRRRLYLSILFSQRDVNSFTVIAISLQNTQKNIFN